MTKNTDNFDNIQFIQYLNRRVLEEAEEAITLDLPGDEQLLEPEGTDEKPILTPEQKEKKLKRRNILKRWNRMWGLKNPVTTAIEKITDMELKIEKQRPNNGQTTTPVLDEKDSALVKHFLAKMKGE